jgi:capsular polysaccharide biosynthesis protein
MIVRRAKPVNIKGEDLWIFSHELEKEFNDPQILNLNNVILNGDLNFEKKTNNNLLLSYNCKSFKTSLQQKIKQIINFQFCLKLRRYFIITDDWSNAYFHWLTDCLPRLVLLQEKGKAQFLILPANLKDKSYIAESLDFLGINNFTFLKKDNWYYFKSLTFPVHLAPTGNYHDETMRKLRSKVTQNLQAEPALKVYISRSKAPRRKIANENEVLTLLSATGFTTVYCEDLSFLEQVKLFSKVKYLVSNHGAGLSNMLFMPQGASVLELRKSDDDHSNCYFSLASSLNLRYFYLKCSPSNEGEDSHTANIIVDVEQLSKEITEMINEY